MKDDGIEDIRIGANYNNSKKSGKKGIIIIFLILLIILVGFIFAYRYLTSQKNSLKETFVGQASNINVRNILDNDIYTDLLKKLNKENYQSTSNLIFSTNVESEDLNDIDVGKFALEIVTKNDVDNEKNYNDIKLSYSGNDVFNMNFFADNNGITFKANEITENYLGVHYDKIKDIFGIDYDKETIDNLKNADKIDLSEEEKNNYLKKYLTIFIEDLGEECFEVQNNVVIQKNSENVNVSANTMKLTQTQLNASITKVLQELKNDKELLEKIVITSNNLENKEETNQNENSVSEETNQDENSVSEETNQDENNVNEAIVRIPSSLTPVSEVNDDDKEANYIEYIINIILGNKLNTTTEKLSKNIDNLITKIENETGEGLVVTIYSSEEKVEKLNLTLPNKNTVDLEFLKQSDGEDNIKLTYLYNGDNNIFKNNNSEDVTIYSAEDDIKEEVSEDQINGFSLEIDKVQKQVNTSINATYSFIENEKINRKISLDINTSGTSNSSSYKSDVIITYSTSEGETKIIIDNNIVFADDIELPDMNTENIVYLDELSEDEFNATAENLINRIFQFYEEKVDDFSFFDTNVPSSIIDKTSTSVTIDEARDALIDRVSIMMREAIDRGEELTIQDLADLTIDGYEVSSTITETEAIIVVDVYTFKIDTNFELTDA